MSSPSSKHVPTAAPHGHLSTQKTGTHAACSWPLGPEAHTALVTPSPSPQVFSDQLASQPHSPDRLPQPTSQKNPVENVANTQPSPLLGCPQSHQHGLYIRSRAPHMGAGRPSAPETYPGVSDSPGDEWDLSSRPAAPMQGAHHRHRDPSIGQSSP